MTEFVEGQTDFAPGAIADVFGDLWGTKPDQIIKYGRVVIDRSKVNDALAHGWRIVPKSGEGCDHDFEWMERHESERRRFRV